MRPRFRQVEVEGWILRDGFRAAAERFLAPRRARVRVGGGDVPRVLDAALPKMLVGLPAVVRVHPSLFPQGVDAAQPAPGRAAADAVGEAEVDGAGGGAAAVGDVAAAGGEEGSCAESFEESWAGESEGGHGAAGAGAADGPLLWIPRGVPVELRVSVRNVTHVRDLEPTARLAAGQHRKEAGNDLFRAGRFREAAARYERAAAVLEGGRGGGHCAGPEAANGTAAGDGAVGVGAEVEAAAEASRVAEAELRVQVYCNLATSLLRLGRSAIPPPTPIPPLARRAPRCERGVGTGQGGRGGRRGGASGGAGT
jgi:hypothetical protein